MGNSITIEGIDASYGAVRVLEGVSMIVGGAETVVLLGTNGNGKSTLMKCILGIVRPSAGRIVADIDGVKHDLVGKTTEQIVDLGIALVPEGGACSPSSRWKRTRGRSSSKTSSSATRRSRGSRSAGRSSPAR